MDVVDSILMELCQNGINECLAGTAQGCIILQCKALCVLGCLLMFFLTCMFILYVVHNHKVKILKAENLNNVLLKECSVRNRTLVVFNLASRALCH